VSGARGLTDPERIRRQVKDVLHDIGDKVADCAKSHAAKQVYDPSLPPLLRLISPLADGADRLVAEEGQLRGFQLEAPLPFPEEIYKSSFGHETPQQRADNVDTFERLLGHADPRVLTLDGDADDDIDRHRSYEAVGRLVVRNCDLLIAVWDDNEPSRGRGGTADTVQFALRVGVPVWWINAARDEPPRWLQDSLDLPRFGRARSPEPDARDGLRDYISRVILPPDPVPVDGPSLWDRVIMCLACALGIQADPLRVFLEETGTPHRKFWNLHPDVVRFVRKHGGRHHEKRAARRTGEPLAYKQSPAAVAPERVAAGDSAVVRRRDWYRRLLCLVCEPFRRNKPPSGSSSTAAALSRAYQDMYRTSYLLVFVCAAVALICAVVGSTFEPVETAMTFVELLMLLVILGFVMANELLRWHERYLSYRMFGELLRLSQHLQRLGWSLSGSRVNNLARGTKRNWVAWFFAATGRAIPLATGDLDTGKLEGIKKDVIEALIGGQLRFHHAREKECGGAAKLFGIGGRWLFFMTLVLVLVRVVLWAEHEGEAFMQGLSLATALLPAFSAALFGLRAYEEFEVLAQQSERMREALCRAKSRIDRVRTDRPLASQVLGGELFDVATIMLSDVEGWAQLFRMKAVEA
jgi:hypothetical protein